MTLLLPLPVSIFLAFISSSKKNTVKPQTKRDSILATFIFISTIILFLSIIYQFDRFGKVKFKDLRMIPIMLNTFITFAYSMNYLVVKNLKLSAILSGVLLGFALYIFF
jgi:hypothetical protein